MYYNHKNKVYVAVPGVCHLRLKPHPLQRVVHPARSQIPTSLPLPRVTWHVHVTLGYTLQACTASCLQCHLTGSDTIYNKVPLCDDQYYSLTNRDFVSQTSCGRPAIRAALCSPAAGRRAGRQPHKLPHPRGLAPQCCRCSAPTCCQGCAASVYKQCSGRPAPSSHCDHALHGHCLWGCQARRLATAFRDKTSSLNSRNWDHTKDLVVVGSECCNSPNAAFLALPGD